MLISQSDLIYISLDQAQPSPLNMITDHHRKFSIDVLCTSRERAEVNSASNVGPKIPKLSCYSIHWLEGFGKRGIVSLSAVLYSMQPKINRTVVLYCRGFQSHIAFPDERGEDYDLLKLTCLQAWFCSALHQTPRLIDKSKIEKHDVTAWYVAVSHSWSSRLLMEWTDQDVNR